MTYTHGTDHNYTPQIWIKDIKAVPDFANFPGALGDYDRGVEYFLNLFLGVNERPQVRVCGCMCGWLVALHTCIHTDLLLSYCSFTQFNRRSSSTTT